MFRNDTDDKTSVIFPERRTLNAESPPMTNSSRPPSPARLIWANAETCADLLYATGFTAPDPYLWLDVGQQRWLIVTSLEIGRALRQAPIGTRALTRQQAAAEFGLGAAERPTTADLVLAAARRFRRTRWETPEDFPFSLARQLEAGGLHLRTASPFFPERRRKTAAEVACIRAGVRLAEIGLACARDILRNSQISGRGILRWQGRTLTAERLRAEIDVVMLRSGGRCTRTIVAPGRQGADPHEIGHGPIRAGQPIVLDIFPRVERTGYHGDLTRTVVKGRAPDLVRRAHAAVRAAQLVALREVRAGVALRSVHAAVHAAFRHKGFATDLTVNPPRGFIHGTGHGLGLDVHEAPRVADIDGTLADGDVVTIEPGLYDPKWGGMRLEDNILVTAAGYDLLSHASYVLEIP
jgi:Xaa-Pro aminopeptidase